MQIEFRIKRIYKDLRILQSNSSMQRDLIRTLRSGGKDFHFLNCFRMECSYLRLTPIEGMPKAWKVEQSMNDNIERLYKEGFLKECERDCCRDIVLAIVSVLRKHRLFAFFYCLFHPANG